VFLALGKYYEREGSSGTAMKWYSMGLEVYPRDVALRNAFVHVLTPYARKGELAWIAKEFQSMVFSPLIDALLAEAVLTSREQDLLSRLSRATSAVPLADHARLRERLRRKVPPDGS
jgi:hypothetical protein